MRNQMTLEDMYYRIDRKGPTLRGLYAIFDDGHTERWDETGEKIVDKITIWGFQEDLNGPTAAELAAEKHV